MVDEQETEEPGIPEQKVDSGTLNQLYARIYYGRLRFFYLAVTVVGYFLGLKLLQILGSEDSYYKVIPVVFYSTLIVLSALLGVTLWRAVMAKIVVKELPALPTFSAEDVPELHFELKTFHKEYKKFSRIDSIRNIFIFSGIGTAFFLLFELGQVTVDPMDIQTLTIRLSISGALLLIGITLHFVGYLFRWKEQTLQTES